MSNITPEYLFQAIGELTIEGRLLRAEIAKLQKEIVESKKPINKE